MSWWQAALLGLVQGLTEFLPVSSSGHLVLGKHLLGLDTAAAGDITFEVFVHFGTVLSIVTMYWRRILDILAAFFGAVLRPPELGERYRTQEDFRVGLFILLSMIPTGLIYILFKDQLEAAFQNPRLVCAMLLLTGLLLLLTVLRKHPNGTLNPWKALLIGLAQGAAMTPGISRSGATICTAIYQNVSPEKAANFSFLMSLPVIVGATLIQSLDLLEQGATMGWVPLLLGTLCAYASGVVAIKIVLDFVRRGNLRYFAYYCFLIGTIGLIFI